MKIYTFYGKLGEKLTNNNIWLQDSIYFSKLCILVELDFALSLTCQALSPVRVQRTQPTRDQIGVGFFNELLMISYTKSTPVQ